MLGWMLRLSDAGYVWAVADLSPDALATLLHLPAPLVIARAACGELNVRVPSWNATDQFVREPVRLQLSELVIDVRHIQEVSDLQAPRDRRASSCSADPLGSIAAMYAFASIIAERVEVTIENASVRLYVRGMTRLRVELSELHARTTNALWQDLRDLTDCVDRSPDGLLKTRFKLISTRGSVFMHLAESACEPVTILRDHALALRWTTFANRCSTKERWTALSSVLEMNLETIPLDVNVTILREMYELYQTVAKWICDEAESGRIPQGLAREAAGISIPRGESTNSNRIDTASDEFALQLTIRFTAHMLIRFAHKRADETQFALTARDVALNWIQHHRGAQELQATLQDISIRHKGALIFSLEPCHDVFVYRSQEDRLYCQWRLQKVVCNLVDEDLSRIVVDILEAQNEVTHLLCGTCHQEIPIEAINLHVCRKSEPHAPPSYVQHGNIENSRNPRKLHLELKVDEIKVAADCRLVAIGRLEKILGRCLDHQVELLMKDLKVSTELKEYVGDAVFVPVLPLAFQMLECSLRGCGCVCRAEESNPTTKTLSDQLDVSRRCNKRMPWPDRVFVDLAHLSVRAVNTKSNERSTIECETITLRSKYSDGADICVNSHAQMSADVSVDRIRCSFAECEFPLWKAAFADFQQWKHRARLASSVLFLAAMNVRVVEVTLLAAGDSATRPQSKFQLRDLCVVGDNQLGHLSIHTSADLRSLMISEAIKFEFDACVKSQYSEGSKSAIRSKRQRRQELLRRASAYKIQSAYRSFSLGRVCARKSEDPEYSSPTVTSTEPQLHNSGNKAVLERRPSLATKTMTQASGDLGKVVAAAVALKGGITKCVKATQQILADTELPSRGSAARILPRCGEVVMNVLSFATGAIDDTAGATKQDEEQHEISCCSHDRAKPSDECPSLEQCVVASEPVRSTAEDPGELDALLASLPKIVRFMVQVKEHRLCVPVKPHERVSFLCGEIIRRYNEMFAEDGRLSGVTLQNPHGGVFAPSDCVALIYSSERELFFATPVSDGAHRSTIHIGTNSGQESRSSANSSMPCSPKRVGLKFMRCSSLPLPLAIALLANEREVDLARAVTSDGNDAAWPELAIDASFLEVGKAMLHIEVQWLTPSIEVANADAFLLCLQQLGICQTRESSRFVGKILRSRLQANMQNALVRKAWQASDAVVDQDGVPVAVTYDALKEIVQQDFGMYFVEIEHSVPPKPPREDAS